MSVSSSTIPGPFPALGPDAAAARPGLGKTLPDVDLDTLLDKVRNQIHRQPTTAPATNASGPAFIPVEPESFQEAALGEAFVEGLLLKYLLSTGSSTGRQMSDQVALSFKLLEPLFQQMKSDQLVVYRGSAAAGDYVYQLTDMGRERARRLAEHCTYYGAAPVSLAQYTASVAAQSLTKQQPSFDDVRRAFHDLLLNDRMLRRIGPAINSGRGLFLYGAPGNGKSSIAERITRAFGSHIWIPKAIGIDGEVIRLYDPSNHEIVPLGPSEGLIQSHHVDRRWVRVNRPTIIVGGELTMDALEVTLNTSTGISEAPLQLKSNCGTLVIDDFGRQRMSTDELLNRWIVPLEKRHDFLNLPNGKKVQVPFDQLIVFSTNLEPRELVDDAFLRRIPYKIDVQDPSEDEFRQLFHTMATQLGVAFNKAALDDLIQRHYRPIQRPFRACQPRDLLMQIKNYCAFMNTPPAMTPENFDYAVENYFAIM